MTKLNSIQEILLTIAVLFVTAFTAGCASQLPALTLSPELLKDPTYYQVIGEDKLSLRDAGHDLKKTVTRGRLAQMMQPIYYHNGYSEHLLVVADRQELQINKHSDTILMVVEGHGYLEGVKTTAVISEHEIMRIPKNTPHAFINAATTPTVMYAVFSPPYAAERVFRVETRRSTFFTDESRPIGVPQR